MSFSSTTRRNDYTGNGTTAEYDYTFRIFDQTELAVTVRDPDTGDETTLVLSTDYTVAGVDDAGGGSITLVDADQAWLDSSGFLDTGWAITLRRILPLTQETDLRNQGPYLPEAVEDQLDRAAMIALQQQDEIDRGLKLPETEAGSAAATTLPIAATRASKFFAWDASGNPIASSGSDGVPADSFLDSFLGSTNWHSALNRIGFDEAADIVAATTTDLGTATGNFVEVTHASGTLAIASLGGASMKSGTRIHVKFTISGGSLSLTHHATNLVLLGSADIALVTGDRATFVKKHDSNAEWEMVEFVRADGSILNPNLTRDLSPAQITGNQNDYNPTGLAGKNVLRLTSDASRNVTGLAGGAAGRVILVANVGSNDIVLVDESASSTAANRFALDGDLTLQADQCVVLVYDGTSSRWRAFRPSAANGEFRQFRVYTSSDTWTKPSGLKRVRVTVVGGGGGGGGAVASAGGNASIGAGGGGGGCAIKVIEAASLGATEAVTVGAAGVAGSAGSGGTGGTSSFGAHCSATGGAGGAATGTIADSNHYTIVGGAGGSGSGGNLNIPGSFGPAVSRINGAYTTTPAVEFPAGAGGDSFLGAGAKPKTSNADGDTGGGYGGGGGGGREHQSSTAHPGGAGAAGVVIVEEYF